MNENSKRIAKNSLMLYIRMLFIMIATLYISRLVLNILGVADFGIYSVVGGVVSMLAFLNNAMATATQRFLSFELGKGENNQLSKVFSNSLVIHLLIAVIVLVLAETIGLWFLNAKMNIPENRMNAANWVYQFSIFTFLVSVFQVPFYASIIAHEKMGVYAIISIVDVIFKLLIAITLTLFDYDKLKIYSLFLFCGSAIVSVIYMTYGLKKFKECSFRLTLDKKLFKTMLSYASWSLFGSSASVIYNQGINILLNIFFGPVVNAARAIAFQVNVALNSFISSFQTAVNPQIVKSYSAGENKYMMSLIFASSKYSFFFLLFISLPVIFEIDVVLNLWLKTVPAYTSIFCRLIIIDLLIGSISNPLMIAAQATGRIKLYQTVVGSLLILNLPISYLLCRLGFGPEFTMIVSIVISIASLFLRLIMLKGLIGINISLFTRDVIMKSILISTTSLIIPLLIKSYLSTGGFNSVLIFIVCYITSFSAIYYLGINKTEREFLKKRGNKLVAKIIPESN